MTMVLNELWYLKTVSDTAISFGIDRGVVQNLMGMASIEASCLLKFCEELEEFWAFRELFKNLSTRLSNICTVELVPLMQLPSVKMVKITQILNSCDQIFFQIMDLNKLLIEIDLGFFFVEGSSKAALQCRLQENRRHC